MRAIWVTPAKSRPDHDITSYEVYDLIRANIPEYDASGYLGGTWKIDTIKWLAGAQIGTRKKIFGSIGPKTMEIAQAGHHWFTGRYLAYLGESKVGRKIFLTSFVDKTVRAAHKELLEESAAPSAASVRSGVRAEHRHHSSAGHHGRRHRRYVRQLPGHDLLQRRADQLVPHGRVSPVRRLRHRGQARRRRSSASAKNDGMKQEPDFLTRDPVLCFTASASIPCLGDALWNAQHPRKRQSSGERTASPPRLRT